MLLQVVKYNTRKNVTIYSKVKRDELSVVKIRDTQTGTVIGVSNPYG